MRKGVRVDLAEFAELRCGAKTRAGTPCKRRDLFASGRCRMHGGMSTGPKSGPRAKIVQPAPPEEPYNPADNPELMRLINAQLEHCTL
ncbi:MULTISPECIES: HGGxSTG domain-containing protein [Billgrantia]|uniref:HGGxSTG domain-containing protein n=1 Tax=Billgrantia TaxID=3137761 RepID=UPI0023EE3FEE|nr:HGGxSTG domain-containing protein [Halomonas zhangzhouensis]